MKTSYKNLLFQEEETKTKTQKFQVLNRLSFDLLGYVKWYAPWRRYCFFPELRNLVFDAECLADIQIFICDLMRERRKK